MANNLQTGIYNQCLISFASITKYKILSATSEMAMMFSCIMSNDFPAMLHPRKIVKFIWNLIIWDMCLYNHLFQSRLQSFSLTIKRYVKHPVNALTVFIVLFFMWCLVKRSLGDICDDEWASLRVSVTFIVACNEERQIFALLTNPLTWVTRTGPFVLPFTMTFQRPCGNYCGAKVPQNTTLGLYSLSGKASYR